MELGGEHYLFSTTVMTGIPIVDAVINFFNFIRVIAGVGIVVFMALLVIGVSGFFAPTYSQWRLFVGDYITGANRPWGRNLTGIWLTGLAVCLIIWFVLGSFQTTPQYPLRPWE
jgi:hypothetical protein